MGDARLALRGAMLALEPDANAVSRPVAMPRYMRLHAGYIEIHPATGWAHVVTGEQTALPRRAHGR